MGGNQNTNLPVLIRSLVSIGGLPKKGSEVAAFPVAAANAALEGGGGIPTGTTSSLFAATAAAATRGGCGWMTTLQLSGSNYEGWIGDSFMGGGWKQGSADEYISFYKW